MFRDSTARCPTCDSALNPTGSRFACQPCDAVFINDDELGALLDELSPDDERPLPQRLFDGRPTGLTCPFCTTRMNASWIHDTGFERCPTHGTWITTPKLQALLESHADLHADRNSDHSRLEALMFVPVLGTLIAIPAQAVLLPWIKRRRLRKYLARTTPPKPR